jgi:hypothetical protein
MQAQGGGTEASESWSQDEPLSKAEGLALLNKLEQGLTKSERKARAKQLESARRFIENAAGGVDAPLGKTFLNRRRRPIRIDIEILAGTAFLLVIILYFCFN